MDLPFPTDVNEWSWETLNSLSNQSEGQYLEYKEKLHAKNEESKDKWKRSLEREITAFANASGGILVFGVNDDGGPSPFEPPEHEVKQSVTRLVQNTTPVVETKISDPIQAPSANTDRIGLVVRVHEATRKPVLTGDSAIYVRINDRKEPMSREQMEAMFVEQDRYQQAIRQLEIEIDRFHNAVNPPSQVVEVHGDSPPDFHLLNTESLREVLQESTHLYADEETREAIIDVFERIRPIDDIEAFLERVLNGQTQSFSNTQEELFRRERKKLKRMVERLEYSLKRLAAVADLQVDLLEDETH
ncbi:AlbA family DNA-binding domain-containing protein [Halorussus ruber]|uniref:AlbA family DNA-binding domain-containing protein n=1 Tax=Halorussus ruber TaxID=1126238 RepID=UPI001091991D|nr:ATP-binding protein [Halorussus ruber]